MDHCIVWVAWWRSWIGRHKQLNQHAASLKYLLSLWRAIVFSGIGSRKLIASDASPTRILAFALIGDLLTFCLLGNFACCFVVCWFFSKSTFSKNSFRRTIRVSNSLDPDQARHFVWPDLDPNYLQRLSADGTSRQGVNVNITRECE